MTMNLREARIIDPVLTQVALGITQNDFVGQFLFPRINVEMRTGKIITFGREHFMQYEGLQRSPGSKTVRVSAGYAAGDYALQDFGVEGILPIEHQQEMNATAKGFTVNGAQMALTGARAVIDNRLEIAQATLATDLTKYPTGNKVTLSGTSQWTDQSGTSNPITDIAAARKAVRLKTGRYPTVGVFSSNALEAALTHPKIIERLNYTGSNVASIEDLQRILRIPNIYEGSALKSDDSGVLSDIWGNDVVLAYTVTASVAQMGAPTYGLTYNLSGYPFSEPAYYGNNEKTWYFPHNSCEAPVITSSGAGYLIKSAAA